MARYRHNPFELEAVRWDGTQFLEQPDWLTEAQAMKPHEPGAIYQIGELVCARALDGVRYCRPGGFIALLHDGTLATWTAREFLDAFSPVPEAAAA